MKVFHKTQMRCLKMMLVMLSLCLNSNMLYATPAEWRELGNMALHSYGTGDWETAAMVFQEILTIDEIPDKTRIGTATFLARCRAKQGQVDTALSILEELAQEYSTSGSIDEETSQSLRSMTLARVAGEKAAIMRKDGRFAEAIEEYQLRRKYEKEIDEQCKSPYLIECRKHDISSDAGANLHIAECLFALGRLQEAAPLFKDVQEAYIELDTAMARNPQHKLYMEKVYLNKRLGDCLSDIAFYRAALAEYPEMSSDDLENEGDRAVTTATLHLLIEKQKTAH